MEVSVVEAKNQLSQLLRAVEDGESVVITRNGRQVAQLTGPPPADTKVRFNRLKGKVILKPGWDDPIDLDEFLNGSI